MINITPTKTSKLLSSVVVCNFIFFVSILFSNSVYGQAVGDYRSNANNINWSATASWQRWNGTTWISNPSEGYPGENPGTGKVTIQNGHAVTLNVSPANAIGELYIGTSNAPSTTRLTFGAGPFTLNIVDNVIVYGNTGNAQKILTVGTGTLNVGGSLNLGEGGFGNNTNTNRRAELSLSTGTVNIDGDIIFTKTDNTFEGHNVIRYTGLTGIINLKGEFSFPINTAGSIIQTTSNTGNVFNYNGSLPQTIIIGVSSINYPSLNINNTHSSGATISAAITASNVLGNITVGNVNANSNFNIQTSNVTLAASRSLILDSGTISGSGTISATTFDLRSGTISAILGGTGALNKTTSGTVILSGTNTYTGTSTLNAGEVSISNSANLGNNGDLIFNSAATLRITGNSMVELSRSIILNTGGGVIDMVGNRLRLTGAISGGGGLVTGGSDLIINRASNNDIGPITINSNRLFVQNTLGAINNSSISVANGATLAIDISGTKTLSNFVTFATGSNLSSRQGPLNVNNAIFPSAGTMIFNRDDQPTSSININGNYPLLTGDLTIQVGGQNATVGTVTLNGSLNGGTSHNLTKTSTGTLNFGTTAVTLNSLTISEGSLTATSGTTSLSGNFTNNATFTANGGLTTLNGTSTQNIGGSATSAFNNLTIANTAQPVTSTANFTASGNFTINNNAVFVPGATSTIGGTGTLTGDGTARVTRVSGSANDFTTQYTIINRALNNLAIDYAGNAKQFADGITYGKLRISNAAGVKASGNIIVNTILDLAANNPNATDGLLDMVIDYGNYATLYSVNSTDQYNNLNSRVLTLGAGVTLIGNADVTGKIRREHVFVSGTPYSFGNANTQLTFTEVSGSALPTSITVVATKGDKGLHVDKDGNDSYRGDTNQPNAKAAVKRLYQVLRTGGAAATRMSIRLAYDNSELNGNDPNNLVLWDHHLPYGGVSPHEHGQTNRTANYVELTGHGLFYLAQENDAAFTKYWMISDKETTDILWIGAVPGGSWDILSNWSDGKERAGTDKIVIPASTTYSHELVVSDNKQIGTIEVKSGGKFTLNADRTLTITGGPAINGGAGSWNNQGTLVAGNNSKVLFTYSGATIAGKGDFHHLEVANGSGLLVSGEVDIKIKGNLTINGTMDAQTNPNTITFNGASQSIPVPTSGDKTGYHHLKIEQTSGNASLTGNTRIGGTLTLTSGTLNVGSNTLSLYGNYFAGDLGLLNAVQTSSLELRNTEGGTKTLPNFTALTNLIIDAPSSVFNLNQSATLYGNLSIANAQLNLSDKTLHRNTAGGSLTIGENGYLKIGGTNGLPQNFTTHSIHNTSTVEYAGTNQEISLPATTQKYGYLILSEAGTKKLPEAVNRIDIDQNMTVQNAAAFELDEGKNLVVKKQFINNGGTVLFKDKSSLVQIDNVTNVGSITYQRKTRELKHLDFVYWGSMVNNRAIKDIWMTNANETFYQFNAATNAWQLLGGTTIMQPGRGYIARARYINGGWPLYNFPIPPDPPVFTSNFVSTPNNGNIPVSVTPDRFNLLGNPYPSAIDMAEFAKQGFETVEEGPFLPTFYIWTQTTPITNNAYTGNDYAYYNVATNTATQVDTFTPTRYINAGQAFFIRTKATSPTEVFFTNQQRVTAENNNFTKPGPPKGQTNPVTNIMDRFWLNLRNTIQDFKQIAIVHIPNATNGYDTLLESPAFNGNTNMNFYSLIGTSRIGIQARASMVPEDEFPIGYQATTAGTYTIELANKEGVFSSHPIYLEDMLTNQVQNLQTGTYSFTTASGVHNNRFKIKYNNLTLSTNPWELQNVVAFISNETLHVKTGGEFIEKMEIYDIQGRLLQTIQGEASAQLEVPLQMANQVILLKIKTTDGKTGTKKLIY
ncbi:MAG: hypothetical protein ACK4K1_00050 [Flavobacterium sp.]